MLEDLPSAVFDRILNQLPGVSRRRLALASRRMAHLVFQHERNKPKNDVNIRMVTDENLGIYYEFTFQFLNSNEPIHIRFTSLHKALPSLSCLKLEKVILSFEYTSEDFCQVVDKLDIEHFVGTFIPFHLMEMLQAVKESTFLGITRDLVVNVDYKHSTHAHFLDKELVDRELAIIGKRALPKIPAFGFKSTQIRRPERLAM